MKRSLILMSICTGFGANLIHGAQTAAAATSAQAPAAATATPGRAAHSTPIHASQLVFGKTVEALYKERDVQPKSPFKSTSSAARLTSAQILKEKHAAQIGHLATARTTKFINFLKKHRFGAIATSAALVCGLLFGQVKYKMISRMFKAAPVTPANAVKVSWLKALTGLSTR